MSFVTCGFKSHPGHLPFRHLGDSAVMEEGAEAPSEGFLGGPGGRRTSRRNGGGRRSALGGWTWFAADADGRAAMEEGAEAPSEPVGLTPLGLTPLAAMEEGAEAPSEVVGVDPGRGSVLRRNGGGRRSALGAPPPILPHRHQTGRNGGGRRSALGAKTHLSAAARTLTPQWRRAQKRPRSQDTPQRCGPHPDAAMEEGAEAPSEPRHTSALRPAP